MSTLENKLFTWEYLSSDLTNGLILIQILKKVNY